MKFSLKNQDSKKFNIILLIINSIALISFILNITINEFIDIILSLNYWATIPKTFLLLMPFLEFVFILNLAENDLNKQSYKKLYPFTFIALIIIIFIIEFIFNISIYDLIIKEWWINENNDQVILLSIVFCLMLGFIKIDIFNISINFYYSINSLGYGIGGLIIVNEKSDMIISIGAPSISHITNIRRETS